MVVGIQIAKFKLCQYQLTAISPNLMLAKVTRYTVILNFMGICYKLRWWSGSASGLKCFEYIINCHSFYVQCHNVIL